MIWKLLHLAEVHLHLIGLRSAGVVQSKMFVIPLWIEAVFRATSIVSGYANESTDRNLLIFNDFAN